MEEEEEEIVLKEDLAPRRKEIPPPRPKQCRPYVLKRLAQELPDIVNKFVDLAKAGSVPHVKELTRMSGLDKEETAKKPVERRDKSFTKLLMEELAREDPLDVEDSV